MRPSPPAPARDPPDELGGVRERRGRLLAGAIEPIVRASKPAGRLRRLGALAAAAAISLASARGAADEPYSAYEAETLKQALARVGGTLDPSPEGKIVEGIDVVPLDVLEPRDPLPTFARTFLNWLHVTTRPSIIEREVLLAPGDRYRRALADETARNLRQLRPISLVLVVPVRGSAAERVRLLVITKDIWSLRLNSNFHFAGGRLEELFLQPSEENLFGVHQTVAAQFALDRAAYSLGMRYGIPRIAGSRVRFSLDTNVIVNRATGDAEGSYGGFVYGQPLYSTLAEWAWGAEVSWANQVSRRFCTADGRIPCAEDGLLAAYDARATAARDAIPFQYRTDAVAGAYSVTRSYGRRIKHDFTVAFGASRRVFRTGDLSAHDPAAVREFVAREVPVSDTRIGPSFGYQTRAIRFLRVLNLNTLGLQEDIALGHEIELEVYPAAQALGSSRDYVGFRIGAQYTVPLGDGIARAYSSWITEVAPDEIPNASIEVGARLVTPSLGFGRLVVDAGVLNRYENDLNQRSSLGGDTRLRGYPTSAFRGKDVIAGNLELRTRPLEVLTLQLGAAAFFDVGDAFDGFENLRPKQSAGFGLRLLFPQLDRVVMRVDWGFPLTQGFMQGPFPGDIVVTFRQAFPMPGI